MMNLPVEMQEAILTRCDTSTLFRVWHIKSFLSSLQLRSSVADPWSDQQKYFWTVSDHTHVFFFLENKKTVILQIFHFKKFELKKINGV